MNYEFFKINIYGLLFIYWPKVTEAAAAAAAIW